MSIEANYKERKAREALVAEAREFVELIGDKPVAFWAALGALCDAKLPPAAMTNEMMAPATRRTVPNKILVAEVEAALEQCDELLDRIAELPDRAADFGDSVNTTVRSISDTIEQTNAVSAAQQRALDNIAAGVEKWFRYE